MKRHFRLQARNLLLIRREHVRQHGVLPGWDLLGQGNLLIDGRFALLDGALKVDVLNLLAEVGLLVDERDKPVLDLQVHLGALGDVLREVALGGEG